MDECLFCKILSGEIPAQSVYKDESIFAFYDINPQTPTHILIIPREHFASLDDIPENKQAVLSHLLIKAREIAQQKGLKTSGYRIVLNTGKDAGQAVFHIHFHLLGGRRMAWPPG